MHPNFVKIYKKVRWENLLELEMDGYFIENNVPNFCDDEIESKKAFKQIKLTNDCMKFANTTWFYCTKLEQKILNKISGNNDSESKSDRSDSNSISDRSDSNLKSDHNDSNLKSVDSDKKVYFKFKILTNKDRNIYIFYLENNGNHVYDDVTCYGLIIMNGSKIFHQIVGMRCGHPYLNSTYFHYANSDGSGPNDFCIAGKITSSKILKNLNLFYNEFTDNNYH
jgi:hypothetical protein